MCITGSILHLLRILLSHFHFRTVSNLFYDCLLDKSKRWTHVYMPIFWKIFPSSPFPVSTPQTALPTREHEKWTPLLKQGGIVACGHMPCVSFEGRDERSWHCVTFALIWSQLHPEIWGWNSAYSGGMNWENWQNYLLKGERGGLKDKNLISMTTVFVLGVQHLLITSHKCLFVVVSYY